VKILHYLAFWKRVGDAGKGRRDGVEREGEVKKLSG
jgi:hypothetical protein